MGIAPRAGADPLDLSVKLAEGMTDTAGWHPGLAGYVGHGECRLRGVGERLDDPGGHGGGVWADGRIGIHDPVGLD